MAAPRTARIGAVTVPLDKCDWVLWRKCGCPRGVAAAADVPTEDKAWKTLYARWKDIAHAIRRGEHMELMTHERWCAEVAGQMLACCTHEQDGGAS